MSIARRVSTVLTIALLILVLAGCGATTTAGKTHESTSSAASSPKTADASTTMPAAAATTAPTPTASGPTLLSVGQSAQVGDAKVTYDKATVSAVASKTAGNQVLLLEFRITYTGKQTYDLAADLQFSLFGQDDRKFSPALIFDTNGNDVVTNELNGTLQSNQSQLGQVAFDVPKTDAPYHVEFAQPFGTMSAEWSVPQPAS